MSWQRGAGLGLRAEEFLLVASSDEAPRTGSGRRCPAA